MLDALIKLIARARGLRIILDDHRMLGDHNAARSAYDTTLRKEEVARAALKGRSGNFLDIGGGDGKLTYLLGMPRALEFDQAFYDANMQDFASRFTYYGLDLTQTNERVIAADICAPDFRTRVADFAEYFDVVYSNNVFEHLRRPWRAAEHILWMLKPGGICITIAPFAIRYHAVPADYFRYSHTGITALFEDAGHIRVLVTGYDISGRRNNWQGNGNFDDIVPVDDFGAWRENWFTVTVIEKLSAKTR